MSCLTCIIQNPCRPAPSSPSEDNKTAFLRDLGFEFRINTQETEVTQRHVDTPRGLSIASCQAPPLLVDLGLISSLLESGHRSQVRLDLRNGERCMLACSPESETGLDPTTPAPSWRWGAGGQREEAYLGGCGGRLWVSLKAGKGHVCKPRSRPQAVRPSHPVPRARTRFVRPHRCSCAFTPSEAACTHFRNSWRVKRHSKTALTLLGLTQGSLPRGSSQRSGVHAACSEMTKGERSRERRTGRERVWLIGGRGRLQGGPRKRGGQQPRELAGCLCEGAHALPFRKRRSVHATDQHTSSANREPGQR